MENCSDSRIGKISKLHSNPDECYNRNRFNILRGEKLISTRALEEALPFKDGTILGVAREPPRDFHQRPRFRHQKVFGKLVTADAYLSGGQSVVVVGLVVRVTEKSPDLAKVETGNVDGADHRNVDRARNSDTVIGLDIAERWNQVSVQILRISWDIGLFVINENL